MTGRLAPRVGMAVLYVGRYGGRVFPFLYHPNIYFEFSGGGAAFGFRGLWLA